MAGADMGRRGHAALRLRFCGADWYDIAESLDIGSAAEARRLVETTLANDARDDPESKKMLRAQVGAQLTHLMEAVWPKATEPDHPEQLAAVRTATGLVDRFSKLYGLDAPAEHIIHTPTETELETWVATMAQTTMLELDEADVVDAEVVQ